MIIWETMIPMGKCPGVPPNVEMWLKRVARAFGGYTLGSESRGSWIDQLGTEIQEPVRRLTVACDDSKIIAARNAVHALGQLLGQECMYFAIYPCEVELLPCR